MNNFAFFGALVLILALCASAEAKIVTRDVPYRSGDVSLHGYLAYDDALSGKRPGVLVFHEWWGLNDFVKERARDLAQMGYVAFAPDMFGETTTDPAEAGRLAGQFRSNWTGGGRQLMRDRARVGLAQLTADSHVDATHLAAIGFCFGGTTALELAYSGAPLTAVVSFHGGLTVPDPADLASMKTRFLILHGADDATVKPEDITAMQDAFRKAKVDWDMIYYGGAKHGFTNPANGDKPGAAVAYNELAARRSWQAMQDFFRDTLTQR